MSLSGVVQAEYEYNALGQQVIRRLTQTGQTIHNVFDMHGQRVAEYDYDDVAGTSTLIREYIWMNGQVVAVVEAGEVYYVRSDHIGRPVFATDILGTVVWEASYLPFGGVHTSTGPNINLRFPGQWFQSEAALHQNWMRDYDPTLGRYIQADPLGLVDGASVYGYALQNPGRYVDPRGELAWGWAAVRWAIKYGWKRWASGSAGMAAVAASAGSQSTPQPPTPTLPKSGDQCEECPPCKPYPAGTIGYREDNHSTNADGIDDHHLNLYVVRQNPTTCKCFWNKHSPYHVNPPAAPNWVSLKSAGRYGTQNTFPILSP